MKYKKHTVKLVIASLFFVGALFSYNYANSMNEPIPECYACGDDGWLSGPGNCSDVTGDSVLGREGCGEVGSPGCYVWGYYCPCPPWELCVYE